MLLNGSPAGENMTGRGLPAGVVPWDSERHPASAGPNGDAQTWEWVDKDHGLVCELGSALAPAPRSKPPERPATTPRPSGKTPRKFEYLEALRGRIGDGDHQITRPEYVALVMLGTYASADLTSARPGHARLAEDLGYTGADPQRMVRRLLASLARKGYVVITHHGTNVVGNVAAEYRLTLPSGRCRTGPLRPSPWHRA